MNAVAHDIIVRPIITEKTSRLMELGQYTFEVLPKANKIEIRKAVEEVFKVKVVTFLEESGSYTCKRRKDRILRGRKRLGRKGLTRDGYKEISSHHTQPPPHGNA